MDRKQQEIYEYAIRVYGGEDYIPMETKGMTERCVEVPWLAEVLRKNHIKSLLDVGLTFASHEYLRLILDFAKTNTLNGIDIVSPERVKSRYPEEWWKEIKDVPIIKGDISMPLQLDKQFDAVSLVSTIEHVGFDKEAAKGSSSAFERSDSIREIQTARCEDIEERILDNVYRVLKPDGLCIITVPAGLGGTIAMKDSLGLWATLWEYERESWKKIIENSKFKLCEQRFFKEVDTRWIECNKIEDLDLTCHNKSYASGVALCVLQKSIK